MGFFRAKSATGAGAIAVTLQKAEPYRLAEVRLTLSAATTDLGSFQIKVDSELGSAFDNILSTPDPDETLTAITNFRYADPVPPVIFPGDVVTITWENAGTKTWGLEIIGTDK